LRIVVTDKYGERELFNGVRKPRHEDRGSPAGDRRGGAREDLHERHPRGKRGICESWPTKTPGRGFPRFLAGDLSRLGEQLDQVKAAGCHLDFPWT